MAWIRSQNGKILLNASMIYVGEPRKSGCELSACIGSDWDKPARLVGRFPTQDQAMDELDRINDWLRGEERGVYQITITE
jgi:hypothetical protein